MSARDLSDSHGVNFPMPRLRQQRPHRLYEGHRRKSWIVDDTDTMLELRARARTFDGAYTRAALSNLGYALLVLKIFSSEFARIGLIYAIMSILLLLIAGYRRRKSDHDFADIHRPEMTTAAAVKASERVWGRDFRTSGDVVVLLGVVCTTLYVALFALVMQLDA
ncbi:hypothetical protein Rt10032_c22g6582 [Rhodotorula toruloides]|uniref:DUF202 domain-containing protein n=1 Tax=Rhodotorula toruloides TaxID=5286 RepID=A0A511KRL2_RHOTO|nr:hypothetical protein Rt10032_c22g6582 [Rhodotorula toruloides]